MKNLFMYAHGGSGNHGCEAIVRSTLGLFRDEDNLHITLISKTPEEDRTYGIDQLCTVIPEQIPYPRCTPSFLSAYLHLKLKNNYVPLDKLNYKKAFDNIRRGDIALSIGGDNYCYADAHCYTMMNDMLLQRGAKTVLWGCSIEPEILKQPAFAKDIARYSLITARESISYEALRNVNPNTVLLRDPAFTLEYPAAALPAGFLDGNMVGINLSPLVIEKETVPGLVIENYQKVIDYILAETNMGIALIPHVVWQAGDDRRPLQQLYQEYKHTERVLLIEDQNCMQLKGIISRCRFFIGARTHATIAAYSTGVPTLVVGYSVKARGIARDLFGTEEGYVLPAQSLKTENELLLAFRVLMLKEDSIRQMLRAGTDADLKKQYRNILGELCQRWESTKC